MIDEQVIDAVRSALAALNAALEGAADAGLDADIASIEHRSINQPAAQRTVSIRLVRTRTEIDAQL